MKENRKILTGQVVSDKMDKTVVVKVEALRQHPRYKKYIKFSKKYKAHDEGNICRIGDKVKIIETRPLSKEKHWQIKEVLGTSTAVENIPLEIDQEQ